MSWQDSCIRLRCPHTTSGCCLFVCCFFCSTCLLSAAGTCELVVCFSSFVLFEWNGIKTSTTANARRHEIATRSTLRNIYLMRIGKGIHVHVHVACEFGIWEFRTFEWPKKYHLGAPSSTIDRNIFNLACASWHPLPSPLLTLMWCEVRYTYCLHVQYVLVRMYCTCTATVCKKEQ